MTNEQNLIVNFKGPRLAIKAGAGAGKTFVLKVWSERNPDLRILYLAYNRAIRDEAEETFPLNVDCMTFHSLAMGIYGVHIEHKLVESINPSKLNDYFSSTNKIKSILIKAYNNYCGSEDDHISLSHFDREDLIKLEPSNHNDLLVMLRLMWTESIDPGSKHPATHDTYLKLLALNPDRLVDYDLIMVDEAQDSNGAKIQLLKSKLSRSKVFLVGDSAQQIYAWQGAKDAFKNKAFADFEVLELTKSFRFGEPIACLANLILGSKSKGADLLLEGTSNKSILSYSLCDEYIQNHHTVICRTGLGCIDVAIDRALAGEKIYWLGGIKSYGLEDLIDINNLKNGKRGCIKKGSPLLRYETYNQFVVAQRIAKIQKYKKSIKILERHNHITNIPEVLVEQTVKTEAEASITITTAHKSKGMDWPCVILHSDFPSLLNRGRLSVDEFDDEKNLAYVAVTRARECLVYGDSSIKGLINKFGRFLTKR